MTVRATINNSAKIRLSDGSTNIKEKIEQVARKLKIAKILDEKLETLSFFDYRMTVLASELIHAPDFLFLDSFLDFISENDTLRMTEVFKFISQEDMVVVVTVDKINEDLAKEFDKLVLISFGRTLYMGETKKYLAYIESKGRVRHPKDTLNSFMGKFQESNPYVMKNEKNKVIDEMIEDVQKKYGFNETVKKIQLHNLDFRYEKFNLWHFGRVLVRKFSINTFKNELINFLFQIIAYVCFIVWIQQQPYLICNGHTI